MFALYYEVLTVELSCMCVRHARVEAKQSKIIIKGRRNSLWMDVKSFFMSSKSAIHERITETWFGYTQIYEITHTHNF